MSKNSRTLDVQTLWQLERVGAPSLSPDGAQAVVALTRHDMDKNSSASSLWLLSTLGGEPRVLTQAGSPEAKDSQPQWSPRGDLIAFVARREQQGEKDEAPQLYVIPPDGGEARRVSRIATGVEAFKWFPDGKRIAFVSWVWPQLKGAAAQARALKAHKERKESAYTTEESVYRFWDHHIPMGRVPHLHVIDVDSGRTRDLFEGTDYELNRAEPDAHTFAISPDGRRIAFAFDPAPVKKLDARHALAEIELRGGTVRTLLQDKDWDFAAPAYSHAGQHLAFLASHQALRHTMPQQLAVLDTHGHWAVLSEHWDREVAAPLRWDEDDLGDVSDPEGELYGFAPRALEHQVSRFAADAGILIARASRKKSTPVPPDSRPNGCDGDTPWDPQGPYPERPGRDRPGEPEREEPYDLPGLPPSWDETLV